MNQTSGVLSGTAPAYAGTSADTIVVNCKAGNAVGGHVSFTVTVTVAQDSSAYSNSKSLQFDGTSTFLQGDATVMNAMDRASNGDGNAWTISMWIKPNSSTSSQTLLNYGQANDTANGAITIVQSGGNNLSITYGMPSNKIVILATSCITANVWQQVVFTFDGGTTGNNLADVSDYYSRFSIAVNGSAVTTYGSHANNGYTGTITGADISDNIFRIGRANNVYNNYFGGVINQVAIWNSDQTANLSAIYNSGSTHNLSLLSSSPTHYYEIESSITNVADISGSAGFNGYNFIASNLVSDTP